MLAIQNSNKTQSPLYVYKSISAKNQSKNSSSNLAFYVKQI